MDQRERIGDLEEGIKAAISDFLARTWTCLPAIVQSVNLEKMTIQALPTIRAYVRQSNGVQDWVQLPAIPDVPILFPAAGQFALTLPIAVGDEVLLIFADRCIDSWWQNGGVQNQFELRMHDLSDAFAIPGPRSLPNVIPSISSDSAQLRTLDGSAYIELAPGGIVNIVAPGGVNITGDVMVTGTVTGTEDGVFDGISVDEHVHGGVQSGGDMTGPPTG